MNAKEYLSQAMWLDKIINNKLEQRETIRTLAEKTTVDFTQEKVSGGGNSRSPMEDTIVKLVDLSIEIDKYIDEYVDLKREIQTTINKLEDMSYQLLLEMRYINGKGWNDIANDMGYDKRYTMKLHGRALKKIDEILKEDTKRHRKTPSECGNI